MRLLRLLTSGKSLVGLENSEPRYRLGEKGLPKFEARKNPFRDASASQPPAAEAEKEVPVASSGPAPVPAVGVAAKPAPGRLRSWLRRARGSWLKARPNKRKAALPDFSRAPQQGELSLDTVKVMRNDLTDSDVEVVAARPAKVASHPPGPKEKGTPKVAPRQREGALARIGSVFGGRNGN